jgi:hypothetical protein
MLLVCLLVTAAVVGNGSFIVLLMNNGETVYTTKGIARATTIITAISIFLFIWIPRLMSNVGDAYCDAMYLISIHTVYTCVFRN